MFWKYNESGGLIDGATITEVKVLSTCNPTGMLSPLLSQLLFLQLYHHGVSARHTLVFLTNEERFRVDTAKVLKNFVQAPRSWQVTLDQ